MCENFKDDTIVGLLMTQYVFQFAFSPFKFKDRDKTVPLVYTSPLFEWRSRECINSEGLLLLSTVHLIKLEKLIYVADVDDVLLEVSEKLYELPYQPTTLSSKFVGPDATHKRLLFIQEQQEKIRKQAEQLERSDKLIQEQQASLVQKQQELEVADKLI